MTHKELADRAAIILAPSLAAAMKQAQDLKVAVDAAWIDRLVELSLTLARSLEDKAANHLEK